VTQAEGGGSSPPTPPSKYKKDWERADALGRFIIEQLIARGLTKNDLARVLRIDRARLRAVFDGNAPLTGDELAGISDLLRVPLFELVQRLIVGNNFAETLYLVDTISRLSEEERLLITSMVETFRKRSSGEAQSPSRLLSRRQRRRSARAGTEVDFGIAI